MPHWRIGVVGLVTAAFVAGLGCAEKYGTHDPGFVAKQWSMTMRELGIVPVFPPREDVQVGDLYVSPVHPEDEHQRLGAPGFLPLTVLVTRADLGAELTTQYQQRSSFPATTLPSTHPSSFRQPTGDEGASIYETGDVRRLRQVGFPVFFSAQISRAGVEAMVPTEAVDVAAGAFASRDARATVSVPVAESYGLPATLVLAKVAPYSSESGFLTLLDPEGKEIDLNLVGDLVRSTKRAERQGSSRKAGPAEPAGQPRVLGYLRLITEVYYARSIDVSIQSTQGGSGGLNARLPAIAARPATTQPAAPVKAAANPATLPVYFEHPTPQQVAQSLNDQLGSSLANASPGVTFRFLSVSAGGVSMRQTYERPIAIGYRALSIKVIEEIEKGAVPHRVVSLRLAGVVSSITPVATDAVALNAALKAQLKDIVAKQIKALRPNASFDPNEIIVVAPSAADAPLRIQLPPLDPVLTPTDKQAIQTALGAAMDKAVSDGRLKTKPAKIEFSD